ncbi:MAG: hypothetical protein KatS3mg129_0356 [Leptospiraceae bacterium]|nr:MAG: hypothetical protein KatS3mg129_0356 [Leptospiraceae bacterium]
MFTKYFQEQTKFLQESLKLRLEKKGITPPTEKDLKLFKEFYDFIKDHIPVGFSLAMGKVRNRTHVLNKNCDLIVYRKWCKNFLKLTGGYILTDQIYSFLSIENELTTESLLKHVELTQSIKTMYAMDYDLPEERFIPLYSILFAYKSRVPLLSHKLSMVHASEEKGIPITQEVDMLCVLDQGIIIKDWEQGTFKIIETNEDTLMWFYILFIEFLDRDNELKLDLRSYIKEQKQYVEK